MDRRKVLMIFIAAWISAGLLTWFLYATTKAPKTEKTVAIQAAAHDMAAGTRLRSGDLKPMRVPEKDLPKMAILDEKMALDRPLLFPVSAGEPITLAKIASASGAEGLPSTIEIGKRAISVQITDQSGVAGLIQPRAHVDVLFTKPGSMAEAVTTTILEDIVVLSIGRTTEASSSAPAAAVNPQAPRPTTQAATLLVTPEQARKLELAKNQGKISLALRNPLDHTTASDQTATTSEVLYADLARGRSAKDLRSNKAWAKLIGPEPEKPKVIEKKEAPPKPRSVIDVYRGDKHVQEIFQ